MFLEDPQPLSLRIRCVLQTTYQGVCSAPLLYRPRISLAIPIPSQRPGCACLLLELETPPRVSLLMFLIMQLNSVIMYLLMAAAVASAAIKATGKDNKQFLTYIDDEWSFT